ncbi:unnamed protein product, partial [Laminaria digitata]
MLGSVLTMATVSVRSVAVAIVAGSLGFPQMAWSAPPQLSHTRTAFLSIPLSQRTTRGCHKQALSVTPPRSCSVSEATDRQTRTRMVAERSGRRTRDALIASDDRAATGTDDLVVMWDAQTVTCADELVWPKSDSPAHSRQVPMTGAATQQLVDGDA